MLIHQAPGLYLEGKVRIVTQWGVYSHSWGEGVRKQGTG